MNEKAALRRYLRRMHRGEAARAEESGLICRHILASDWYRQTEVLGGYMPLKWEADITPVLLDALRSGRTLALPLCGPAPRMTLRRVASLEELVPGAFGIPEPREDAPAIPVAQVGLLLTPLEGIDPRGMRLGKGGGYYDRLLAGSAVRTMGCALSWQLAAHIPADPWDRPLSAWADCTGVHLCGRE